jgi:D-alanyl-D-alanine carboxypeptidase
MISRRSFALGLAGAAMSNGALAEMAADTDVTMQQRADAALVPLVHDWQRQSPHTPGVAVGVQFANGYVWNRRGFGLADLTRRRPMPANEYMRIGSVTKTFTGTVLLQLVDQGLIGLDDPLSKYIAGDIPPVPEADQITIRMLGNMTSGIPDYIGIVEPNSDPAAPIWRTLFTRFTPRELVEIGLSQPPYFAPGQGWHYSNTNTVLLGMIIENRTKRSLGANIRLRVLEPLGMTDTVFPLGPRYPGPHPEGYSLVPPDFTSLTEISHIEAASGAWASGNMISTPRDLLLYAKPLATGQLISPHAQQERTKWLDGPIYPPGKPFTEQRYGFALMDMDGLIGHSGSIQGYNTFMAYLPAVDASIVVISNVYHTADPGLDSRGLCKRIADLLLSH